MVFVDTSVWIDFFRKNASLESEILNDLIESEEDIAISGLIRQEILQGVRDELTLKRIKNILNSTHYLFINEPDSFDHAAEIYRHLRKKGVTLRSPQDCLIAAIAMESNSMLLHHDSDFGFIAKHFPLKIFKI